MTNLPYWIKIIIRLILLPSVMLIHLIPHIYAYVNNICLWIKYGGEFITHKKEDKLTIGKLYIKLKEKELI